MSEMPHIGQPAPWELQERLAKSYEAAAASYAHELSTERDPVTRDRLAAKAKRSREQAAWHQAKAAELKR